MRWVDKYALRMSVWRAAMVATVAAIVPGQGWAMALEDVLAHTYTHNPALEAARAELKAVDENMAQANSGWRPTVVANYERGRQEVQFGNQDPEYDKTESRSLQVTQPLFRGGQTWASTKAARAAIDAQRAVLMASEQDVLLDAAVAYVDVIRARELVELTTKNESVLDEHLKATRDRFDVGEVTRTDVSQAEARFARATSDRVQAEGGLVGAIATFERVTKMDVPDEMALSELDITLPESVAKALEMAVERNPTFRRTQYQAEQAEYSVLQQKGGLLPTVNLVGRMSRVLGAPQFGSQQLDNNSLTVNVTVPLYQGGAQYSAARQAARQFEQSKEQSIATHDRVREAVLSAWEDLITAQAVIQASREAIVAAETALEGVEQEHLFGARTTLDVLDAEQEFFEARVDLVVAERNEAVALFNLANLLGLFTAESLKLPVDLHDPTEYYKDVKYQILGW